MRQRDESILLAGHGCEVAFETIALVLELVNVSFGIGKSVLEASSVCRQFFDLLDEVIVLRPDSSSGEAFGGEFRLELVALAGGVLEEGVRLAELGVGRGNVADELSVLLLQGKLFLLGMHMESFDRGLEIGIALL